MQLDAHRRARVAVTATFAIHAIVAGTIGPWIPTLKANARLDAGDLGLALAGFAAGLIVGTRLAGPAIRLWSGRLLVRAAIPVLAAGLAALVLASGLVSLAAVFVLIGLMSGLLDVAMNDEAVEVEARAERRVMSALHGTWSLAVLGGAAAASLALAAGVSIDLYLPVVAAVLVVAGSPLLRWLPARGRRPDDRDVPGRMSRAAGRIGRLVLLCLIAAASFLVEGVALEWSAVLLREGIGTAAGTAGAAVVAFSAGMTISRFTGDRLGARTGDDALARWGAAIGGLAIASALVAGRAVPLIAAFGILGLGLGPVVPSTFRAAGAVRTAPGRSALGIVVTAGYGGSIVGPLLLGFVADAFGLRVAFAIPVVACVVVAAAAGAITRPGRADPLGTTTAPPAPRSA